MKAAEKHRRRLEVVYVQVLDGENDEPRTCSLRDLWPLRSHHGYQALLLPPLTLKVTSKVRITAHGARWMNNKHWGRRRPLHSSSMGLPKELTVNLDSETVFLFVMLLNNTILVLP
jgi:hypothetical protein